MTLIPFAPAAGGSGLNAYVVPPSGDGTGRTDSAQINAIAQNNGAAYLLPGTYYYTQLLPDSYGAIIGSGRNTLLRPGSAASSGAYAIALKNPATTAQVTLERFRLSCLSGLTPVTAGIQLDNTGFTPISQFVPYDPMHVLDNILVLGANGDAYHFDNNARELRVSKCVQYFCTGVGFYRGAGAAAAGAGCTDSHFTDCTSGPSGGHGWLELSGSGNNMHTGNKAFFSGFNELTGEWDTTSCGFEIQSTNSVYTGGTAQQAALHGIDLQSATQVSVTGNEADTNSAGTSGGVGINVNASTGTVAHNTGVNNGSISPGAQAYGVQVNGDLTGMTIYGNTVTGTDGDFNYVGGFGNQLISAEVVSFNAVSLVQLPSASLYEDGTVQALTTGATISNGAVSTGANYSLYPVSSVAAVTGLILAVPPNGDGTQVTIINTTAFALTFAAASTSHVADGVLDVIPANASRTFTFYGASSLWYRSG